MIFHWHKWEFVKQQQRAEHKDFCTIYPFVNYFRCVKCQKEVWQDVKNPTCAYDIWNESLAPVRKAIFR